MSVNLTKKVAYGFSAPTVSVQNDPVRAQRSPTVHDKAFPGQQWINQVTNQIYFLASVEDNIATWVPIGGAGSLTFESGNDASTAAPALDVITFTGAGDTTVTAAGSTVTITSTGGGGSGIITLDGNTGTATGSTVTITTGTGNAQGTSLFTGNDVSTIDLTFEDANFNVGIGKNSLSSGALSGEYNVALGHFSGLDITSGIWNTCIGSYSGNTITSGSYNTCVGYSSGAALETGTYNTLIGLDAGFSYSTSETSNICIGAGTEGTIGESHVLRIGESTSTDSGGIVKTYICGIDGVDVGSVASVVSISGDQLGTTTITGGTGITVTSGTNTITLSTSNIESITVVTTNYAVQPTDYFLLVNSPVGPGLTITFPNTTTTGRQFVVKDGLGRADLEPITLTTVGGAVLFDANPTYELTTQFEAVNIIFDGTDYVLY